MKEVIAQTSLKKMVFQPNVFLNGHQQTVLGAIVTLILKKLSTHTYSREFFRFSDGGTIALDWVDAVPSDDINIPIIAFLPGVTGNSTDAYIRAFCQEAKTKGYQGVVISYRGADGVPMTTPKIYGSASTDDLREPLRYIFNKYCIDLKGRKKNDLFTTGFSMGGNLMANMLGEDGEHSFITAACILQPPMKILACADNIYSSLFGFYNRVMGVNQWNKWSKHAEYLKDHFMQQYGMDLVKLQQNCKTQFEWDENINAPVLGYKSRVDYYDKASSTHRLSNLKTPTFFLFARDDPLIGTGTIDPEICKMSPYIMLGVTEKGGHLGYYESPFSSTQWFTQPAFEFLSTYLE